MITFMDHRDKEELQEQIDNIEISGGSGGASVTSESITEALGYVPADENDVYKKDEFTNAKGLLKGLNAIRSTSYDVDDALANTELNSLKLYGRTWQNGTPSIDSPKSINKIGHALIPVSVRMSSEMAYNTSTITIPTDDGFHGVKVLNDIGAYHFIDENGQKWYCDEYDFSTGKYTKRVRKVDNSEFTITSNPSIGGTVATVNNVIIYPWFEPICTHLPLWQVDVNTMTGDFMSTQALALQIKLSQTFTTNEELVNYLNTNGFEFYIPLSAEVVEDIPESIMEQYRKFYLSKGTKGNAITSDADAELEYVISSANFVKDVEEQLDDLVPEAVTKEDVTNALGYIPANEQHSHTGTYEPKGESNIQVTKHNTDDTSHNDIRLLIEGLTNRLNALANSTDVELDQMAEIVAYIKSNKSLIDSITTSKVNVSDIIDNLTTSVANKPLSAKQGVVLKSLIDGIVVPTLLSQLSGDSTHRLVTDAEKSTWNAKSNFSGSYNDLTNKPTIPTVPTKVSAFENDKGYLTSVPSEYITETELNAKGYITLNDLPLYNGGVS